MTHLYLLRHGIAFDAEPGEPDSARRLSPEGESEVRRVARGLRRLKVAPDRVVTSPLPRATKTAEIVAEGLEIPERLEVAEILGTGEPAGRVHDWLRSRPETRLMLVGHNPGLSELLGLLLGLADGATPLPLKKGGVAALKSDGAGAFTVQWAITPKLVDRLTK